MSSPNRLIRALKTTATTTQTSEIFENEEHDALEVTLKINTLVGGGTLTLAILAVASDGSTVTIFTGPAEAATGAKRYRLFAGSPNSTTEKNAAPPVRIQVSVTPGGTVTTADYFVDLELSD